MDADERLNGAANIRKMRRRENNTTSARPLELKQ
jgi:hypothetical protein